MTRLDAVALGPLEQAWGGLHNLELRARETRETLHVVYIASCCCCWGFADSEGQAQDVADGREGVLG